MKKYIKFIAVVFLSAYCNNLLAQEQTEYEKKNIELLSQVQAKWGNKAVEQINKSIEKLGYDNFYEEIAKIEMLYSLERGAGNKKYAESATKGIEIEALFWYSKEWKKIKTLITNFDYIKMAIKKEFKQWNKKGEFEKQTDYEERLKNQSESSFADICIQQIKKEIDNIYFSKELLPYDSEKEYFNIRFKYNRSYSTNSLKWQSVLKIPITEAENFKNNFLDFGIQKYEDKFELYNGWLIPTELTLFRTDEQSNKEQIIEKYDIPIKFQNQKEIAVPFDGLGIDNPYLKGYVFTKAIFEQQEYELRLKKEQIAKEKQRLDSLELATLNNRLDSIFNDYNRQLIHNKYNVNKVTLDKDFEATCNFCKHYYAYWRDNNYPNAGEIESVHKMCVDEFGYLNSYKFKRSYYQEIKHLDTNDFDEQILSLKKKFDKLQKCFECEYLYNYYTNKILFSDKNEFDSFYTQGKDAYSQEIENRTILNYLTLNAQVIESMNLQSDKLVPTGNNYIIKNTLEESLNKPYSQQVLDFVIETNKGLNKEWIKNGQLFENKIEFYKAYISENYKKILKANKKK